MPAQPWTLIYSPMEYREDYWNSRDHKAEFIRFLKAIHNLDLSLWDNLGYWDRHYRPFSSFDGDTLAASVCVYSLDMVVAGKPARVAQISGVGTRPAYRRQGLSTRLTQQAIDWAREDHDFFFLFADDEAVPLYEKFGFHRVVEHKTRIAVAGRPPRPGASRLDPQLPDHRDLIYRLATRRTAVSDQLGVLNPRLFMFWCLYGLADHIYHLRDLDLLVLYKRSAATLTLCDIVGERIPPFADIYPYISAESDRSAEFLFMTDKLGLSDDVQIPNEVSDTFVMGHFPLAGAPFIFPLTAQA